MSGPQVIMIVMLTMGTVLPVLKHGQRRDPHDGRMAIVACALNVALLWWGGFWS